MKLLLFLLFLSYNFFIYSNDYVENLLNNIKIKDKQAIKSLFQILIYEDHFGYTLTGYKAVSLSGDFTSTPWEHILIGCFSRNIWKKWSIWEEYSDLFKGKNFILLKEQSFNFKEIKFLILINKKVFVETVKKHQNTFDEILRRKVDPVELLKNIELGHSFQAEIQYSETLWGILLGFGEHNARLFDRRDEISQLTGQSRLLLKALKPSEHFNSLKDEERFLWQKLQAFEEKNEYPLSLISAINFSADLNDPETQKLKAKYEKSKRNLMNLYENKNLLEVVLKQLMSD